MTLDEMKRRYRAKQEQIRKLEAVRAEAIRRGEPVPGRVRLYLAEARIEAEELRRTPRHRRTWPLNGLIRATRSPSPGLREALRYPNMGPWGATAQDRRPTRSG